MRGRAALALAGVEPGEVPRGATLVGGDGWRASHVLRADVATIPGSEPPGPRARLRLHLGTTEVGARVVGDWGRGGPAPVRLLLDGPVVARAGDRFVLRGGARQTTLGGGIVTDPHAARRARRWPAAGLGVARRLALLLAEARTSGIEVATLGVRLGVAPPEVGVLLDAAGATAVQGRAYGAEVIVGRLAALEAAVAAEHRAHPLRPGAPAQTVRAGLGVDAALAEHVLRVAVEQGVMEADGGAVRLAGWRPSLDAATDATAAGILAELDGAGDEPPTSAELADRHGPAAAEVLRHLERAGEVRLVGDRWYRPARVADLLARLHAGMEPGKSYAPAELRETLGLPRRLAVPLLEHADRVGVTRRSGDGRVRIER